jgi:CheY-like chemotaxis protein
MSVSILVVDDAPGVAEMFRQHFRREARHGTYVLHFAASGGSAGRFSTSRLWQTSALQRPAQIPPASTACCTRRARFALPKSPERSILSL